MMGLFGFGRKRVVAELAGHNLANAAMDPDKCWQDVCKLRSYKTNGPIATCEMAFAHGGLVQYRLTRDQPPEIVTRIRKSIQSLVEEMFDGEDTPETEDFYEGPLSRHGHDVLVTYANMNGYYADMASFLGSRLGVPGVWSSEIAPLFEVKDAFISQVLKKVKVV